MTMSPFDFFRMTGLNFLGAIISLDTSHTFHITKREMTVAPFDFFRMNGLSFEGVIISLDGVSSVQLGINMLGRKYSTKTIHYLDLVLDYMFLP